MFAIGYAYAAELLEHVPRATSSISVSSSSLPAAGTGVDGAWVAAGDDVVTAMLACLFGLAGGFLTATIGTGADIALYAFGTFGWNVRHPRLALGGEQLTAAAVVTMAMVSAMTALARALTGGFSRPTLLCWAAMAPVVVIGAPVGSLILSPAAATWLRRVFYVLATSQFAAYLIFAQDVAPLLWRLMALGIGIEVLGLASHFYVAVYRGRRPRVDELKELA